MISVIIPIYNAEKYIDNLFLCISEQSYQNFEVLLVNNNSTDNSYNKMVEISKKDNRFKILEEHKQGPNYARLKGFTEAQGEYIYFCDSDDFLFEHTLEKLHNKMIESDSDIVIADYCEINEKREVTKRCKGINFELTDSQNLKDYDEIFFVKMPLWNKLFRKNVLKNDFFIFTNIGEDMLITLSSVAASKKISYVNAEVYYYLVSDTGLSYNVTLNNVIGIVNTCEGMNQIFTNIFKNEFRNQIQYIQIQHLLYRLLRSTLLDKQDQIEARKVLIPFILDLNIKDNHYFKKSTPFKAAYFLLVNKSLYNLNKHILKFLFTSPFINKIFKILDR